MPLRIRGSVNTWRRIKPRRDGGGVGVEVISTYEFIMMNMQFACV